MQYIFKGKKVNYLSNLTSLEAGHQNLNFKIFSSVNKSFTVNIHTYLYIHQQEFGLSFRKVSYCIWKALKK